MLKKIIFSLVIALSLISPAYADSYQFRANHNPDGIGKFYMGREIAQVMGHQGASWLERSPREKEEQPQKVIDSLKLKSSDAVADIGAGTGYFSFRIAPSVNKVYAVDIQPEMIEILTLLKAEKNNLNVEPILSTNTSPNLPTVGIDLALMVDAYHEFDYPQEMMKGIVKALKPNGRVALVEYKAENPFIAIKPLHKMTTRQVIREMQAVGLDLQETRGDISQQHLLIFTKSPNLKS
ncbi:methylase involved in ubiquinone/menaquinone biosynthesis [Synechococcus sp. PCC 7502]|uniref:class I SAM-dependent methyltransferase n=1 Tax=Synechococcus sp. PCC 7502 TaxID=1173263 RepID=UPI00029FC6F8|nr:class I SAM-dependent methyltransferase [Synechococcus sp. PCC 7502]AFY74837.1 methylase involved in ubiquinone/menaquinone biosynthesis [Synechococcus sp. PCC 7502]